MHEAELVVAFLDSSFTRNAWHGPALLETLEGVDANLAARKLAGDVHSIWELVLHITQWKDTVTRRIDSETLVNLTDAEDWPHPGEQNSETWNQLLARLNESHATFVARVRAMSSEDLERSFPAKTIPIER